MDATTLPGQPIRDESTTKKQAGSDRNPLIVELLASFALQVEHRNSNVELGPKMVRVPLHRITVNGMTRSGAFPCTTTQPPELRGVAVTVQGSTRPFGIAIGPPRRQSSLDRRLGRSPKFKSPEADPVALEIPICVSAVCGPI